MRSCRMTMNVEWECRGLLMREELTPLSQCLIPRELASAFNIPHASSASTCTVAIPLSSDVLNFPQPAFESLLCMQSVPIPSSELDQTYKAQAEKPTIQGTHDKVMTGITKPVIGSSDLNECAQVHQEGKTVSFMTGALSSSLPRHDYGKIMGHVVSLISDEVSHSMASPYNHMAGVAMSISEVGSDNGDRVSGVAPEASSAMQLRLDLSEEVDSGSSIGPPRQASRAAVLTEDNSARTLKKPRLVWTPQLHKRFVDAVAHLGIKNAVPKTIMQLMNVDGLTRENVASHLQKYRLYLKRMQGLSTEGPSSCDHLFASTPLPSSLAAPTHFLVSHRTLNNGDGHPASAPAGTNVPNMLGHVVPNLPAHLCSSTPSYSPRFGGRAASSTVSRPIPRTLMSSEHMRETYGQHSSSPNGSILTLFPTNCS